MCAAPSSVPSPGLKLLHTNNRLGPNTQPVLHPLSTLFCGLFLSRCHVATNNHNICSHARTCNNRENPMKHIVKPCKISPPNNVAFYFFNKNTYIYCTMICNVQFKIPVSREIDTQTTHNHTWTTTLGRSPALAREREVLFLCYEHTQPTQNGE